MMLRHPHQTQNLLTDMVIPGLTGRNQYHKAILQNGYGQEEEKRKQILGNMIMNL